jgi:hypothetical protein
MRHLRERPDKHYRGERCTSHLNSHPIVRSTSCPAASPSTWPPIIDGRAIEDSINAKGQGEMAFPKRRPVSSNPTRG